MRMQSQLRLVLLMMDWAAGTMELFRSDQKSTVVPLPQVPRRTDPIQRVWWAPEHRAALVETTDGQEIAVELPIEGVVDQLASRKVVYLDQNHWSTLARSLNSPSRVASAELQAAHHLTHLVDTCQIVLPLSVGHLTETAKWTNDVERKQLAVTMLRLSRGWQVRDPLHVRRTELLIGLRDLGPASASRQFVFTLEPNAIYSDSLPMEQPPFDLPKPWAMATRSLLHLSVITSVMLDDASIPMGEPSGWVERLQRFTDWLAAEAEAVDLRHGRTNTLFFDDVMTELAKAANEASVSPEQLSEWVHTRSDDAFAAMPALGLYRESLREKLYDPATRWEANDLQDLMQMTVAAAYADAAVGDRNTIGTLTAARRRHQCRAILCRNLTQLVRDLP